MSEEDRRTFEANVVIFREDSAWTALALEMDVRGYGATPEEALRDVVAVLQAQVSFALQMGHPESVWHPAEEKYWQMWEEARRSQFVAQALGSEAPMDRLADFVPLSLLAMKHRDEWIAART